MMRTLKKIISTVLNTFKFFITVAFLFLHSDRGRGGAFRSSSPGKEGRKKSPIWIRLRKSSILLRNEQKFEHNMLLLVTVDKSLTATDMTPIFQCLRYKKLKFIFSNRPSNFPSSHEKINLVSSHDVICVVKFRLV